MSGEANAGITIAFLAPPIIIASISFLLAHIFDDSDRHRAFWATLRARYILTNRPPSVYALDTGDNRKYGLTITQVLEDILYYRGLKIHYGVVSLLLLFGFALLIAILLVTILHFIIIRENLIYGDEIRISYVIIVSFIVLVLVCILLQSTYMAQNRAIAKRIDEFERFKFSSNEKTFMQDAKDLFMYYGISEEFRPGDIRTKIYWFSKRSLWLYLKYKP